MRWLLTPALVWIFGTACQASAESGAPIATPGSSGGTPNVTVLTLSFEGEPIRVAPRTEASITARVQPAGAYTVRFSLLDTPDGGTLGAALNRGEAVSSADGRVSVVLTAPDTPTTFRLRAQVDAVYVDTNISVEAGALTTLNVVPSYTGIRTISEWTASVLANARCSDFTSPPPDGPYLVRALLGSPLRLVDVPAAAPQAVVVRAGSFARGCTTVEKPTPNGETEVDVTVNDAPVNLSSTVLDLVFGLDSQDSAFKADLQTAETLVQATLRGSAANDPSAVLDAMAATLPSSQRALFSSARTDAGWDMSLPTALGRNSATRVSEAFTRWLRDGQGALLSPNAFQAELAGNATNPDVPTLKPQRIAGVVPDALLLSASGAGWSVDPRDTLAFAGSFSWSPSTLVCAVSAAAASAETGKRDLASAIASLLSCDALGAHLAASDADSAVAWTSGCDATCEANLCTQALGTQVQKACGASGKTRSTLTVLATGATEVGSDGQAVSLSGNWVGRLTRPDGQSETGGALRGSAPRGL